MKGVAALFVAFSLLAAGASTTEKKIQASKKVLDSTVEKQKKAKRRLDKIAADIKRAEKEIEALDKKIAELEKNKDANEARLAELKRSLASLTEEYESSTENLENKRKRLYSLLAQRASIIHAMRQGHEPGSEAIIKAEIYEALKRYNTDQIERYKRDIFKLKRKRDDAKYARNKVLNEIKRIEKQKKQYTLKKAKKAKLLEKLAQDEDRYTAKLQKLEDKQNALRQTLVRLNILRKKEVEEEKRRAEARKRAMRLERERKRKLRIARQKAREKARKAKAALRRAKKEAERAKARKALREAQREAKRAYKESDKVRQINSSYKKPALYVYKGGKTIPPIPGAKVVKKFGTFIDPIYKIKVFNEGITLQAPRSGAKVQSVLSGKVVYAGNSSMLGKVVVIAHGGKMHTIYAGLSKIAPTIRVGSKIRKGYVIGKVAKKLIFQATKNSKHINPLRLIRL